MNNKNIVGIYLTKHYLNNINVSYCLNMINFKYVVMYNYNKEIQLWTIDKVNKVYVVQHWLPSRIDKKYMYWSNYAVDFKTKKEAEADIFNQLNK